jgi:hypothetical protein
MRELAKSVFSFSWAISLLGIDQAVNLVRPGQQSKGDVFTPIAQVAVNELDESMKAIYRFGDNVQTRMVDMAFSLMNPGNLADPKMWNPLSAMGNCGPCSEQAGGTPSGAKAAGSQQQSAN